MRLKLFVLGMMLPLFMLLLVFIHQEFLSPPESWSAVSSSMPSRGGLETFEHFTEFGIGFKEYKRTETEDGAAGKLYGSPFYDPFNYTLGIMLKDGTQLHAHLNNVRLGKTGGSELGRYKQLQEGEYYLELNMQPATFQRLVTNEWYNNCDMYQIIFVQQYLSDTYLDMTEGDKRE